MSRSRRQYDKEMAEELEMRWPTPKTLCLSSLCRQPILPVKYLVVKATSSHPQSYFVVRLSGTYGIVE